MAASPYEALATALKTVIDTEFAPEGIVAIHDNLHASLGQKRVSVGIAPTTDIVNARSNVTQETWLEVKFFDLWKQEISPETVVNPFKITAYAERFRDAVRVARTPIGSSQVWFYDVVRIEYPNDPTGNKSRFVATIKAYGNNSGLVETV